MKRCWRLVSLTRSCCSVMRLRAQQVVCVVRGVVRGGAGWRGVCIFIFGRALLFKK